MAGQSETAAHEGSFAGRPKQSPGSFVQAGHDHRACVAGALDKAEALCRRRGARLTPLRRRVLELVWTGHAPVGAYEVLGG